MDDRTSTATMAARRGAQNSARLRCLVAGNGADLAGALVRPWPWFADLCVREAIYAEPVYLADATAAARAWADANQAGEPFDLVMAVLEPGNGAASWLPDTSRREPRLCSGLGLFAWIRRHGGADTRLVALTDQTNGWGAQSLYAALARLLVDADVVDLTRRDTAGRPLLIPNAYPEAAFEPAAPGPLAPFDADLDASVLAASMDFDARAQALARALDSIAAISYRGSLSKSIGHPFQWLRTLAKVEYDPQVLALVAKSLAEPAAATPNSLAALNLTLPTRANLARSRHTLARYIARTFDISSDLASHWLAPFDGWGELGDPPPPRFWSLPLTKAARTFIDVAFPILVFEDIDPAWPPRPRW
ncbi:MAG: hypothetical protein LBS27_04355 [Bifidobacteriaceae bacterium]|jgi:hypothetical protein|nr:hypothetical protein [Bifidobacteriaceae bacterium]